MANDTYIYIVVQSQMVESLCSLATVFLFFLIAQNLQFICRSFTCVCCQTVDTGDKQQFNWGSLAAHVNEQQVVPTS